MNDVYNELLSAQHPFFTVTLERDGVSTVFTVDFYDRVAAMASYIVVSFADDGRLIVDGEHQHLDAEGLEVGIVGGTVEGFVNDCYVAQTVKISEQNRRLAAANG